MRKFLIFSLLTLFPSILHAQEDLYRLFPRETMVAGSFSSNDSWNRYRVRGLYGVSENFTGFLSGGLAIPREDFYILGARVGFRNAPMIGGGISIHDLSSPSGIGYWLTGSGEMVFTDLVVRSTNTKLASTRTSFFTVAGGAITKITTDSRFTLFPSVGIGRSMTDVTMESALFPEIDGTESDATWFGGVGLEVEIPPGGTNLKGTVLFSLETSARWYLLSCLFRSGNNEASATPEAVEKKADGPDAKIETHEESKALLKTPVVGVVFGFGFMALVVALLAISH